MSSAILYVAIVAIWAGVLIPRWLRRDSPAQERDDDEIGTADTETVPSPVPASSVLAPSVPASSVPAPSVHEPAPRARPRPRPRPREDVLPAVPLGAPVPVAPAAERSAPAPVKRPVPAQPREERPEVLAGDEPGEEHRKVLASRRRLLGMLLALALGSCVLAVTKMAAWWVVVPPVVMLTGYLGLLREASKADAERRELAYAGAADAATHQAAPPATAAPAAPVVPVSPVVPPPAPVAPDAEVIDISASVGQGGKEFYDQYADAKLRAVGDLPRPPAATRVA